MLRQQQCICDNIEYDQGKEKDDFDIEEDMVSSLRALPARVGRISECSELKHTEQ